jgi:hypothetical protein
VTHRIVQQSGVRRVRRPGLLAVLGLLSLLLTTCTVATPAPSPGDDSGPPKPAGPAFGVLGSHCEPERASALAKAGVRFAELELSWSQAEPTPGHFDEGYLADVRRMVTDCRSAGLGVVATLGVHSAPTWVSELPAGVYRDQSGDRGPDDVPNVVFSGAVRGAVSDYLTELDSAVGLNTFAAIRVGTGGNGELGYPSATTEPRSGNPFWAFDQAAQKGVGLADGASVSPMPGWKPGTSTWQGADVSTDDVRGWFRWYTRAVADAAVWVIDSLRDLGFTGDVHLPLAGRGALPADLEAALAAHLDGTADRDGSLEHGLFYPEQLARIAGALKATEQPGWGTVSADASSVDDATAVSARALDPPQDSCRPGDADGDLLGNPAVDSWSSFRWTIANARRAGLGVVGENPGSPDAPGTGGNSSTDGVAGQMAHAPRYARECGLTLLMWAFEDDLFSDSSDVSVASYARQIRGVGE